MVKVEERILHDIPKLNDHGGEVIQRFKVAKKQEAPKPVLERVYNVPLRKEYMKVPRYKRSKKAVKALREFLQKHMKSPDIKLSHAVNEKVWKHGIKNPPHHVKVTAKKDDKGTVIATLFGEQAPKKKLTKKEEKKVAKTSKPEVKQETTPITK